MIKLYRGDCLDVMPTLPDKSVDMILCDLPYGTTACKWDQVIPFEKLWPEYKRLIKDNGAIVLFGSEPFSSVMRMSNLKMYKYDWVWEKSRGTNFMHSKYQPLKVHETISIFSKYPAAQNSINKNMKYYPQMTLSKGHVISVNAKQSSVTQGGFKGKRERKMSYEKFPRSIQYCTTVTTKGQHQTQKPVLLGEYLIKTYTLEGETVLDNTMGSGSFGVSAVNTNRNFIGIEKDCPKDGDKHFRTAIKRITEAGGRGIEVVE